MQADVSQPLAVWLFIHPSAHRKLCAWLRKHKLAAVGVAMSRPLKQHQVKDLIKACGTLKNGEPAAKEVFQHAGEIIRPRAGQVHYVTNLQPCLKVALDLIVPEHGRAYLQSWREIACNNASNAPDYMAFTQVLVEACTHAVLEYGLHG